MSTHEEIKTVVLDSVKDAVNAVVPMAMGYLDSYASDIVDATLRAIESRGYEVKKKE